MGHLNTTQNRYDKRDHILNWLAAIDTPSTPIPASESAPDSPHRTKRRRLDDEVEVHHSEHPHHHAIPTPSLSSSCSRSPIGDYNRTTFFHCKSSIDDTHFTRTMSKSPRKRTREHTAQDLADLDDEASYEETPRATRQRGTLGAGRHDWDNRSAGTTPSVASSSIASGTSSPTKQILYAAKQDTGFESLNFEPHLRQLPPRLRALYQDLAEIATGTALLPRTLQETVSFAFKGAGSFLIFVVNTGSRSRILFTHRFLR